MTDVFTLTPESYRPMSDYEASLLARLLELDFEGRDAIAQQVRNAQVREIDEFGSIEFKVDENTDRAAVTQRVPVEGEANDSDGVPIWIILFVVDGRIDELEICKADGTAIVKKPLPSDLQILRYPRPK